METTRGFKFKLKSITDEGTFTGLGNVYGNVDLQQDLVMPGAFTQSIQSQGKGLPLLWCHDQETPLGIAKLSDSREGLVVDGTMLMADPNAQRILGHMKLGSVKGLSIGFLHPDPAKTSYDEDGVRILREIHLVELSLTPVPANPLAVVQSVKSLKEIERFMKSIPRNADAETLAHLKAINRDVKRLLKAAAEDESEDECECVCDPCMAGDCEDCDDPECADENCACFSEGDDKQKAFISQIQQQIQAITASVRELTGATR